MGVKIDTPGGRRQEKIIPPTDQVGESEKGRRNGRNAGTSARRGSKNNSIPINREIDFWPEGKTSLSDFLAEKAPTTHVDRTATILHWLLNVAERETATAADIYGGYDATDTPFPTNQVNNIDQTRFKGMILGGTKANLTLTTKGQNRVRHQLPAPSKAKS